MAQDWQAFPSSTSTGINRYTRTEVDPVESVGAPTDAAATDVSAENSAISLAKAMLRELGVSAGAGDAVVNTSRRIEADPYLSLGDVTDPPATNTTAAWSAISLLKGICAQAGL